MISSIFRGAVLLLTFACLATSTWAQSASIGSNLSGKTISFDEVDHSSWDTLLRKYVDKNGDVNYSAWKASSADARMLDSYVDHLASASPKLEASRDATLAYWINAYNAVTVHGIMREYPTTSIKNHVSNFGGYSIWKHYKLNVDGRAYSLDDMEHKVLRKMDEPRIHFAVVCASRSCPRLLNRAYTAKSLESQLQENSRHFFSKSGNFRYDASKGRVYLSSILKWYGTDFAPTSQKQLQKLVTYLPDSAQPAVRNKKLKVTYQKYDWGLNDQATSGG